MPGAAAELAVPAAELKERPSEWPALRPGREPVLVLVLVLVLVRARAPEREEVYRLLQR